MECTRPSSSPRSARRSRPPTPSAAATRSSPRRAASLPPRGAPAPRYGYQPPRGAVGLRWICASDDCGRGGPEAPGDTWPRRCPGCHRAEIATFELAEPWQHAAERVEPDGGGFACQAVLPIGGWPVYGASRMLQELRSHDDSSAACLRVLDAGLEFLHASGIGAEHLNGWDHRRWNQTHGPGTW